MRDKILAGNWKMNKTFGEAEELIDEIADQLSKKPVNSDVQIIICPPFPYLEMIRDLSEECDIQVGAQNLSQFEAGAYTGEVSAAMLSSMQIGYCIIGHSERRQYFGETDEIIAAKIKQALNEDIFPIFCCGENLTERESGRHFEVVQKQVEAALSDLPADKAYMIIIAYEPVWAIGTGKVASPEQAQEMHAFIRKLVAYKFGEEFAENLSILYGGSCNPSNAAELFKQPDVDGGLIGGASLKAADFIKIAHSFPEDK
ncbi:MAG: triose-phosphate isomerase [Bacteroidales bacterium]|nr:triose-phosphate isomerase [Bacteroidales bacterium]